MGDKQTRVAHRICIAGGTVKRSAGRQTCDLLYGLGQV